MKNIMGEILPLEYSVEKILATEEGAIPRAIVRSTNASWAVYIS